MRGPSWDCSWNSEQGFQTEPLPTVGCSIAPGEANRSRSPRGSLYVGGSGRGARGFVLAPSGLRARRAIGSTSFNVGSRIREMSGRPWEPLVPRGGHSESGACRIESPSSSTSCLRIRGSMSICSRASRLSILRSIPRLLRSGSGSAFARSAAETRASRPDRTPGPRSRTNGCHRWRRWTDSWEGRHAIWLAFQGAGACQIRRTIEHAYAYDLSRTVDQIRTGYSFDETCQGTVPEAITCALESVSFEDAVRNAVSLGGDADTLAAIAGPIAEALRGIPEEVISAVKQRYLAEASEIIRTVVRLRGGVEPSSIARWTTVPPNSGSLPTDQDEISSPATCTGASARWTERPSTSGSQRPFDRSERGRHGDGGDGLHAGRQQRGGGVDSLRSDACHGKSSVALRVWATQSGSARGKAGGARSRWFRSQRTVTSSFDSERQECDGPQGGTSTRRRWSFTDQTLTAIFSESPRPS